MSVLLARRRTAVSNSNAITGTLIGPTTVATSQAATATAYSNQRKIDRCQNGVLWTMWGSGQSGLASSFEGYGASYSTDDGATWNDPGTASYPVYVNNAVNYTQNCSFFIDLDDYAHFVYKDQNDGYIYYRRGTPNAGRTAWTWSAATQITFGLGTAYHSSYDYPDIVAHREGAGWAVHIVGSNNYSTSVDRALYARLSITSAGVVSVAASANLNSTAHANTNHKYPSIDFNHTGDGKTVAGGTPHLYVAWSAGRTGSGLGIRFKKATYSGGAWTWGTERDISTSRLVSTSAHWINCLFDGTRVIIAGQFMNGAGSDEYDIFERDAADTAGSLQEAVVSSDMGYGSAAYDQDANVYLFGKVGTTLGYRKWVRATGVLENFVSMDGSANSAPHVSAKRGYSNGRIEFIYTDGTSSPYNVVYGGID